MKEKGRIKLSEFVSVHFWKNIIQFVWKSGDVRNSIALSNEEFEKAAIAWNTRSSAWISVKERLPTEEELLECGYDFPVIVQFYDATVPTITIEKWLGSEMRWYQQGNGREILYFYPLPMRSILRRIEKEQKGKCQELSA